jgi:hypothetical protein
MDIKRAKELLGYLADGINPVTGEVLPEEDCCNQADVVRALNAVLRELDKRKSKNKELPENVGKPWTKEDEKILCQMFDAGYTRKELCEYFKRSSGGIAARLVRLGEIEERIQFR